VVEGGDCGNKQVQCDIMFSLNCVKLARLSRLLDDLDSLSPRVSKNAIKLLDEDLYPKLRGRFTTETWNKAWEEHSSQIRGTEIAELLNERISNGHPNARKYALSALTHIGDSRARPHILTALKDPEPSVRVGAINCCSHLRENRGIPSLIELLSDESDDVVTSAAYALGRLRAFDAIPKLLELATRKNPHYRASAISALGCIKDHDTLPLLRAALRDRHRSVRKSAKLALATFDLERRKKA
jgi:HEAT repeat protein